MSWRVEIVEVLNKENDFEGEEWWAVVEYNDNDEVVVEHTFEVRNEQTAIDLYKLLDSLEEEILVEQFCNANRKESQEWLRNEIKELKIDLRCISHAIEKAANDIDSDICGLITEYYYENLESEGVCSHLEGIFKEMLEEISSMDVQKN